MSDRNFVGKLQDIKINLLESFSIHNFFYKLLFFNEFDGFVVNLDVVYSRFIF